MNPERITVLRAKHGGWSPHRHHHPFGSVPDAALDVLEVLDALESACTERDTLHAEVQRLWGEIAARDAARVPQIDPLLLERIEVRTKGYVEMAAMLNDWIRANTIPALRAPVAKGGESP